MKNIIKLIVLILLTWLNLKYYPILLVFPFPFFAWVLGFILLSIWTYLFLYVGTSLIFKTFNIKKSINKTYLALIFPLFFSLYIGASFIPLEYQPSFSKFEELCKNQAGTFVHNQEILKLWDGWDGKQEFGEVIRYEENTKINWRITKSKVDYNYIDHQGKKHKISSIVGFYLKIFGMLNDDYINCGYFENPRDQK